MIVELHIIQNFAPSNLNRSDTGTPKDCEFGGYRRARISSQCFKRAVRDHFESKMDKSPNVLAFRSKRLHDRFHELLADSIKEHNVDIPDLSFCIEAVLATCGIYLVEEQKQNEGKDGKETSVWVGESEVLAFLGKDTIQEAVKIIEGNPEQVAKAGSVFKKYREEKRKGDKYKGNVAKDDKKDLRGKVKKALGKEIAEKLEKALDGSKAADLALFGRMLADLPEKNVDAACQVAHAISTHKVGTEFDFYTAVDDLLPKGETGAGMMGTLEFNSACFYRYANVNLKQLKENLKDDELERATLEAFIRAFVDAVPSGKQNSYAAQQKPSFVLAVVRESGLWNLANAFVKPVRTEIRDGKDNDLVQNSIEVLDKEWGNLSAMYGSKQIKGWWFASLNVEKLLQLGERIKTQNGDSMIDALVTQVKEAITQNQGGN